MILIVPILMIAGAILNGFWPSQGQEVTLSWVPIALMAAGALMGAHGARKKKKLIRENRKRMRRMAALDARYSPWVAMQSQYNPNDPATSGQGASMLAGAMQGYKLASGLPSAGAGSGSGSGSGSGAGSGKTSSSSSY